MDIKQIHSTMLIIEETFQRVHNKNNIVYYKVEMKKLKDNFPELFTKDIDLISLYSRYSVKIKDKKSEDNIHGLLYGYITCKYLKLSEKSYEFRR